MNVTELDVYKLGFQFTLEIYKVTEKFPKSELFGLTSHSPITDHRSLITVHR